MEGCLSMEVSCENGLFYPFVIFSICHFPIPVEFYVFRLDTAGLSRVMRRLLGTAIRN